MRINLNPPADATAKNESTTFLMIRFAITYSVFLLYHFTSDGTPPPCLNNTL